MGYPLRPAFLPVNGEYSHAHSTIANSVRGRTGCIDIDKTVCEAAISDAWRAFRK
jgi:hypothetical protein